MPDVLMPGIWHGIRGVYRSGDKVTIYTDWTSRSDATGACLAADGDLGYVVAVTVYGSGNAKLATCGRPGG